MISVSNDFVAITGLCPTTQTAPCGGFSFALQEAVDAADQIGELQGVQTAQGVTGAENGAVQESVQASQPEQPEQQAVPQEQQDGTVHSAAAQEEAEEVVPENPKQLPDAADPDSELLKELEDLLSDTEKMMTAPERMKEVIRDMILQAYEELNDPEMTEEEFTEMVLDFLMEFIRSKFGGENEESSVTGGETKDDEDLDVNDVLMQVVVQMLDNIRSEDRQEQLPDDETVDGVASAGGVDDVENVPSIEPVTEETKKTFIPSSFGIKLDMADKTAPETEGAEEQIGKVEDAEGAEKLPEDQTEEKVWSPEIYQAAMETAESIYYAIAQPQTTTPDRKPTDGTDESGTEGTVSPVEPADELQELIRLVRTGDSARSEQLDLTDHGEKTERPELADELPKIGQTASFETVMVTAESEPVLTRSFGLEGSSAQQVVTQIVSEIFNNLPENGGSTTFVMTLNPEALGKVTVKLVEEAGKISVSVTAHSKQTAELLANRFESLQTAMKDNGTQLEKYQVVYAPEKDEGSQKNFDGSSKNPYVKQDDEEGEGGEDFAELLQQVV